MKAVQHELFHSVKLFQDQVWDWWKLRADERTENQQRFVKGRIPFAVTYVYNEHSRSIHPFRSERRHFNLSTTKKSSQSIESRTVHLSFVVPTGVSVKIGSGIPRLGSNGNYVALRKRKNKCSYEVSAIEFSCAHFCATFISFLANRRAHSP